MNWNTYKRTGYAIARPWVPGEAMAGISVSEADAAAGSPRRGDMIARNPKDYDDQWLIAAKYFQDNFEQT